MSEASREVSPLSGNIDYADIPSPVAALADVVT
jgi:hypothetical protein